jgi:hypothetical protein
MLTLAPGSERESVRGHSPRRPAMGHAADARQLAATGCEMGGTAALTSVLGYLVSGICPGGGRLVFTASDGGADDSTQVQRDAQSDLGGDECHHGTEGP